MPRHIANISFSVIVGCVVYVGARRARECYRKLSSIPPKASTPATAPRIGVHPGKRLVGHASLARATAMKTIFPISRLKGPELRAAVLEMERYLSRRGRHGYLKGNKGPLGQTSLTFTLLLHRLTPARHALGTSRPHSLPLSASSSSSDIRRLSPPPEVEVVGIVTTHSEKPLAPGPRHYDPQLL